MRKYADFCNLTKKISKSPTLLPIFGDRESSRVYPTEKKRKKIRVESVYFSCLWRKVGNFPGKYRINLINMIVESFKDDFKSAVVIIYGVITNMIYVTLSIVNVVLIKHSDIEN